MVTQDETACKMKENESPFMSLKQLKAKSDEVPYLVDPPPAE